VLITIFLGQGKCSVVRDCGDADGTKHREPRPGGNQDGRNDSEDRLLKRTGDTRRVEYGEFGNFVC
jgi:hypothetical protein